MSEPRPRSRPALTRAPDADLHPALAARPGTMGQKRPAAAGGIRSKGIPATSDTLRPTKSDPLVTVKVKIPKSMRKRLRKRAKQREMPVEALAAEALATYLADD